MPCRGGTVVEMGLHFQQRHDETRIAAPVVPIVGGAVESMATTRPAPNSRSTANGAPLRSRAMTCVGPAGAGFQSGVTAKKRSTVTALRNRARSPRKTRKMG